MTGTVVAMTENSGWEKRLLLLMATSLIFVMAMLWQKTSFTYVKQKDSEYSLISFTPYIGVDMQRTMRPMVPQKLAKLPAQRIVPAPKYVAQLKEATPVEEASAFGLTKEIAQALIVEEVDSFAYKSQLVMKVLAHFIE